MKKTLVILAYIVLSISTYAQELVKKGPHGGEVLPLGDFQIEMVKKGYRCLIHPEIVGGENDLCKKCESNLERDKKIEFHLLDDNFNEVDTSNFEGRVRFVFKDETAVSKRIRINDNVLWVPLGNNGFNNYQQAFVNFNINNKTYKATFGHPIVHKGHHH